MKPSALAGFATGVGRDSDDAGGRAAAGAAAGEDAAPGAGTCCSPVSVENADTGTQSTASSTSGTIPRDDILMPTATESSYSSADDHSSDQIWPMSACCCR